MGSQTVPLPRVNSPSMRKTNTLPSVEEYMRKEWGGRWICFHLLPQVVLWKDLMVDRKLHEPGVSGAVIVFGRLSMSYLTAY